MWRGGVAAFRAPFRGYGPFARKAPWGLNRRPTPSLVLDFAGTRAVDSRITYTGGNGTVVGADGLIQFAPHNLLTYSQAFDDAGWTKSNSAVTPGAIAAPDSTTTGTLWIPASDGLAATRRLLKSELVTVGVIYTVSVYVKQQTRRYVYLTSPDASSSDHNAWYDLQAGTVAAANSAVIAPSITSVGGGWYRITASSIATSTTNYFFLSSTDAASSTVVTADGTSGVYIWGAQLNRGARALTYVPTTTAAAWSPRIDYDATGACRGLLIEEARTNLCGQPCDLTAAGWTASNVTAAATQAGPDGVANSASSITAGADAGTILFAITSASAARATSAYVKRLTGTGAVEMTQDGGTTWAAVTVTSAWTRVTITSATVTNPSVGFRMATNTDAIAVFGVQCETGAFATSVLPSPAALARTADNASITGANFSAWYRADEGTIFAEWSAIAFTQRSASITDGTQNNAIALTATTTGSSVDTYVSNSYQGAAGPNNTNVVDVVYRQAGAYKANDAQGALAGLVAVTDVAYSVPTVDRLLLGQGRAGTSQMNNGYLRRVAYYARRLSAAQLRAITR
jgi:hypothetical protein